MKNVFDRHRADRLGDSLFKWVSFFFAASVIALMVLIFVVLVKESWLSLKAFGFGFIYSSAWDPVAGDFGALDICTLVSS